MEDKIKQKAKELYDKTRPDPRVVKVYGEKSLSPIQRATLTEIEAHLELVDRIGKEYGKSLDPEKYKLGVSEAELRESAKIYWTKGRRIQAAKNLVEKKSSQRELIQKAMEIQPNSHFLNSLFEQTFQRQHQLSKKQIEAVENIINNKPPVAQPQPPQSKVAPGGITTLESIHARRSPQARALDEAQKHSVTFSPTDKRIDRWKNDQGSADVTGIDTFHLRTPKMPSPRKAKAKVPSSSVKFGKMYVTKLGRTGMLGFSRHPIKGGRRK
jgi:hypothetical protein